jgi:hypothetical protein
MAAGRNHGGDELAPVTSRLRHAPSTARLLRHSFPMKQPATSTFLNYPRHQLLGNRAEHRGLTARQPAVVR